MKKGRNCSLGAISPLSTILCKLILDFCVKTRTRLSLRERLFEVIEVEITKSDCILLACDYLSLTTYTMIVIIKLGFFSHVANLLIICSAFDEIHTCKIRRRR